MKKWEKEVIERYKRYLGRSIYDCYKNPSSAKIKAWNNIIDEMWRLDGYNLAVLSYNTNMFTCAYIYNDSVDNIAYLVYHTPTRREMIALEVVNPNM